MASASSSSMHQQQQYQQQQQVQQYQQFQQQEEQHLSFEEFQRQKQEQEYIFQQQQLQFKQKQQQFKQQRLQIQQQQLSQYQQQYQSTSSFQQYEDNGFYAQNSLLGAPPSPQIPRSSRTAFHPPQTPQFQQQRSYENGFNQQQSLYSSQQLNEFSSRETASRSSAFQETVNRRSEPHFLKPLPSVLYFSEGQPARLEIEVGGNPTPQISWFKDNYVVCHSEDSQIISNKGSHVLKMPEIYLEDSGLYKAVITSSLGKNESVCQVIVER